MVESSSPDPNKVSVPSLPAIQVTHYVDELLLSTTRDYVIKSISQQGRYHNRWMDMQIIRLSDIQEAESGNVIPVSIPKAISKEVRRPLGMIGNNHRLVFCGQGFLDLLMVYGYEARDNAEALFPSKRLGE